MKNKKVVSVLLLIAALIIIVLAMQQPNLVSDVLGGKSVTASYVNPANEATISVTYKGDKATLESQSFHGVVFTQTVSADGARYENADQKLVLWNKGTEITLYQNDKPIFSGSVPETK